MSLFKTSLARDGKILQRTIVLYSRAKFRNDNGIMSKLAQAIQHLEKGEWTLAHEIVQADNTALGAWLHGIVHIQEGDLDNARYWYRRAKREFVEPVSVADEINAAKATLK